VQEIARGVAARLRARRVIVFGSYAKGIAAARSDVDLLVVADTVLPRALRACEVEPLLARTLVPVDVHVYTPEEIEAYGAELGSFIDCVLRTGRVVHG
jgi:predicted nucleotidyltransferase